MARMAKTAKGIIVVVETKRFVMLYLSEKGYIITIEEINQVE